MNSAFSQVKNEIIYQRAIEIIRKSDLLHTYSKQYQCNENIKVSKFYFSFCEFYSVLDHSILTDNIKSYCAENQWMNKKLEKNKILRNVNKKVGRKDLNLLFTNKIDIFFIAEVKTQKRNNHSILFLFKIEDDKIILQKEMIFFIN